MTNNIETTTINGIQHIKLSELTRQVEQVLKGSFGSTFYWIVAEISSHKFYPNEDRHYFDFVEKGDNTNEPVAKARGVSWFSGSQCIKVFERSTGQKFSNGLQVLVKVKVEYHIAFGLSLVLHDIDQSFTLGNLERQRRETLAKLLLDNPDTIKKVGEEYLTRNKEVKLNFVIQNIALVGSPNSEGYNDFTHNINNNQFGFKFNISIYHSSVQGGGAELELVNKLISIYQSNIKYDCIVIIRGGGAKTDFLVFDTYKLSRAVARFPIPIITGIGHHKDISIVDLMVHTSTKTPTKAAEFIIAHNRTFEDNIITLQKGIIIKTQQLLSNSMQNLNTLNIIIINNSRTYVSRYKDYLNNYNQIIINKTKSILYSRQTNLVGLLNQLLSKPKIITANRQAELNNILGNIKILSNKYLVNQRGYLGHFDSILKLMSPLNILKKGFAIIYQKDKIITSGESIQPNSELLILMNNCEINTKVIKKTKTDGTKSNL